MNPVVFTWTMEKFTTMLVVIINLVVIPLVLYYLWIFYQKGKTFVNWCKKRSAAKKSSEINNNSLNQNDTEL